ncbi:uncharacterized protein LOC142501015 [Ascaphus truei]|uniref:uncharacterized protein LOC142501015 n=1 Tax=Ascaphus truei TaxID=8439 RepID=UPI003F595EA0
MIKGWISKIDHFSPRTPTSDMIHYVQTITITAGMVLLLSCQAVSETPTMCSVVQGLTGLNGRDGRDGTNGLKGDPGQPGNTGAPGIRGGVGPPGKEGPKGYNGVAGPQGQKGVQGLTGVTGGIGLPGMPGIKGDTGPKGEKGDPDVNVATQVTTLEHKIAVLEKSLSSLKKGKFRDSNLLHPFFLNNIGNGKLEFHYRTIQTDMLHFIEVITVTSAMVLLLSCPALPEKPTMCSVVQGLPGLNGRDGRDGANGVKGDPGPSGQTGAPGQRGGAGSPGKAGPQGQKENQGDKGMNGPPGLQGLKGEKGSAGATGQSGIPGKQGVKGEPDVSMAIKVSTLESKIAVLEKSLSSLRKVCYFQSGATTAGNKVYVTNGKEADYSTAQAACERAGGTLPTPLTGAENAAISQVGKAVSRSAYIGINDKKDEGVFVYLNGKQIAYKNWKSKEPNGGKNENCAEIYDLTEAGQWNDRKCDNKNIIVCEF